MAKILDQHGNPIQIADIAEPQTARIVQLQNQVMSSQLDGISPARVARILRQADDGDIVAQHQLFDDMLDRDAHLRCEFEKRQGAITSLDWSIVPPSDASPAETKSAQWVEEILRDVVDDFEDVLLAMMEAPGHGFSAIEIEWVRWGSEWLPRFHPRPQTWFRMDRTRRHLRLNDGSGDGAEPIPMGWIMHAARKVKTGYGARAGLFRPAVCPFLYKAYSLGDFAEFLETYGLPIIVGKYMSGANDEEKSSLLRAVAALGHDARAIMPDGMSMEIKQVTTGGSADAHLKMVDWADRAHSKLVLGQVLSAEAKATGMGSGVADLQAEVRSDIRASDARQLASTLTRDLVYPLIALNKGSIDGLRRCPRLQFDLGEAEDLKLYSEALPVLAQNGARIRLSWVHEKLRIPEAGPDEPVFGAPAAAAELKSDPQPPAALSAVGRAAVTFPSEPAVALAALTATVPSPATVPDARADGLSLDAVAPVGKLLDRIRDIVAQADSLEALQAQLVTAFGDLPIDELARVMEIAFAAADLAGRADVAAGR